MCKVSSSVHFVTRSVAGNLVESPGAHWVPNTDVYETDSGLVVKVELAGMRSEHLEITVEGRRMRIAGNRPDGCRAAKCSFLVMEINYGPFESLLELPAAYDLSQAKAAYLNGFLRIDVPLVQRHAKNTKVLVADGN
ncbi:MAG TPA: Hsp20/alpha crystallin family protein [Verrucomicrobiota bacterium]|nr:Hsp20/alpha crystallin family protein [Verrucomicrobiota bacterium]